MRALIGVIWLLHWLPLPLLGRLGEALGSLLYVIMKPRRRICLINLRLCFPELDQAARVKIARAHFQAYARSALERGVLWWASEARLKRLIRIEGELPLTLLRSGPSILLCPHFVCLEIPGIALVLNSELSVCTIYTQQQNKVVDDALLKGRSRFRPVTLLKRAQGVKPIIRAMREGLPFIMLPDMDFGLRDSAFVPFFGIEEQGVGNYLKSYVKPTFIMLPFNIISELSRTLALAVRLFGNMMSGAMIIAILLTITPLVFPIIMTALGLLTGMVQAYIFSILAAVYIAAATRTRKPKPAPTT